MACHVRKRGISKSRLMCPNLGDGMPSPYIHGLRLSLCLIIYPMIPYSNPVWDGYCADPFVLRHDDFYYAYGTGPSDEAGRQFVVLRSPDLVHWERQSNALEPVEALRGQHHWAPEVAFAGGKFWMYYSAAKTADDDAGHRLRVAVADAPGGPFRDCGRELLPGAGFSIDASPFRDPQSGRWFLYYAADFLDERVGTGTAVVPLADDMTTVTGEPQTVVRASSDWQIYEHNRFHYEQTFDKWHTVEGPFVIFREGRYYCFYAAGNWQKRKLRRLLCRRPKPDRAVDGFRRTRQRFAGQRRNYRAGPLFDCVGARQRDVGLLLSRVECRAHQTAIVRRSNKVGRR